LTKIKELRTKGTEFVLYDDSYFEIKGEMKPGTGNLFLALKKKIDEMTPEVYKHGLQIIDIIKQQASKHNIKNLYVVCAEDLIKFETMFGFDIEQVIENSKTKERLVIMVQPTGTNN
jgi:hypothetical protein